MDVRTPCVLQFEALEKRLCLSTAHAGLSQPSVLRGTIQVPVQGDPGADTIRIAGNGSVSPLGPVSALGTLTSSAGGGSGDIIDLASGDGGLVLNLDVNTPHAGAAKPRIHFTIIGGTGTFTSASGQGTITERRGNAPDTIALELRGTIEAGL